VQTGIGAVRVKVPRVRDRRGSGRRFHSALLPPDRRQSQSLDALRPWLYRKGVSTGACAEAFQARLGPAAPGLSPATISRLQQGWHDALAPWQQRALAGKRYVSCWGMFGIRVKRSHRDVGRAWARTRWTIAPTTERLTRPAIAA
jgi:transposase-like protein